MKLSMSGFPLFKSIFRRRKRKNNIVKEHRKIDSANIRHFQVYLQLCTFQPQYFTLVHIAIVRVFLTNIAMIKYRNSKCPLYLEWPWHSVSWRRGIDAPPP